MVASGVTARGLDIKGVMHVINYDLPSVDHGGIDEYVHRIGRTARIGNRGQSTSFYNDRDIALAEPLVKILLECKQEIPDFLQEYVPADSQVVWDDDTDNEEPEDAKDTAGAADGDAWGGAVTEAAAASTGDNWGSSAAKTGDNGGWGGPAQTSAAAW